MNINEKNLTVTIRAGVTSAITGISITPTDVADLFSILVNVPGGFLSIANQPDIGGQNITLQGSIDDVNSALANLMLTSNVLGNSFLYVAASEAGNEQGIEITNNLPTQPQITVTPAPVTVAVALQQSITQGASTVITGLSVIDAYATVTPKDVVYVNIYDIYGSLAINGSDASISGNNSNCIAIAGSLTQVNAALALLTYTNNTVNNDQIRIQATDGLSGETGAGLTEVIVNASSQSAVSTGPTASVAQGSTTTVSGVAVNPAVVTLSNEVSLGASPAIFTVTVTGKLGTLSDVPVGTATVAGSGSHSISVTGNLTDVNATLSALKYTASSVGQDVLSMTASVAGTSATSVGTKIINVGVVNTSIENTPKNQAIGLFYQALHSRLPDADGLVFWASSNASVGQIANAFMQGSEFTSTHGTKVPNAFFVNKMYGNALGRPADAAGSAYWKGQLDSGASQAAVLVGIATSAESQLINAGHFNHGFLVT